MATMFELTNLWQRLQEMMQEQDPETEDFQCISDTLESIEGDIDDKLDAREWIKLRFSENKNACEAGRKTYMDEARRMGQRAEMWQRAIDEIDKGTIEALKIVGGKRKTPLNTYWIGKSVSCVCDVDPVTLPEELTRVKTEVDLTALKEALKEDPEKYGEYGHLVEKEGLRKR